MSHTPGPWKVFYAKNGKLLGVGQDTGGGITDAHFGLWLDGAERDANARLIAAAPDMLAALKWAESALAPFSKEPAEKSGMALIRAAIAKAEGRQP